MRTRFARAICLFCFLLICVFAQQKTIAGQPQSDQSVAPPSADHTIALDVVVTDKSGRPVPGLQQQDFTLLDNKQPQKILSFQAISGAASAAADQPTEVILLLDEVNDSFGNVSYEREQVEKFLQRDGGELPRPVSMVFFTDTGTAIGSRSTQDGNALVSDLNQSKFGLRSIRRSQGVYGAGDRLELSLNALKQLIDYEGKRPGRKLLIWISPGWPLLSGPGIHLTTKAREGLFGDIIALGDGLRRARITLYSIDPLGMADAGRLRTTYYQEFVKPVKKANDVQIGNLGLQVLATQSGGRVLNSSNDIAGEIATCITDANAFYAVSFEAQPGDGPNDYHSIEIKIDKPGLTTHTRSGYYAQPDAGRAR
jgi:VWFA-related protein